MRNTLASLTSFNPWVCIMPLWFPHACPMTQILLCSSAASALMEQKPDIWKWAECIYVAQHAGPCRDGAPCGSAGQGSENLPQNRGLLPELQGGPGLKMYVRLLWGTADKNISQMLSDWILKKLSSHILLHFIWFCNLFLSLYDLLDEECEDLFACFRFA